MSKKNLKAGIIGCGGIARSHVNGYKENGVSVVAITDVSKDAMQKMSEEVEGAACFADYRELIDSGKVDMVSICTPPVAHEEAIVYALSKGVHVLCEKPLSHSAESAAAIKAAVAGSNAVFMGAFRHRFLPANCKLKEMVESGKIGAPVMFRNVFGGPAFAMKDRWFTKKAIAGGGCLLDTNSHSVDLFRFIIGEVVEQHAVMHRHFEDTDVEDSGLIIVKAENGTIGSIGSGFVLGDGMAFIDITGQDGRVIYDYTKPDVVRYKQREAKEWEDIPVEPSFGFNEQIDHFIKVINGEEQLLVGINDGVRCQEIIQANYS